MADRQNSLYQHLIKSNPVYHLLYSPLNSLKSKQKDILIQCLSKDLKQKCIQLQKSQTYKSQAIQLKDKITQLQSSYDQQLKKLQDQIRNSQTKIRQLNETLQSQQHEKITSFVNEKEKQLQLKAKSQLLFKLQKQIFQYKQENQNLKEKLKKYMKEEENQQKIRKKQDQLTKRWMLSILKKKANKYAIFLANRKKRYFIQYSNLRLKCFNAIKNIYLQQKNIDQYIAELHNKQVKRFLGNLYKNANQSRKIKQLLTGKVHFYFPVFCQKLYDFKLTNEKLQIGSQKATQFRQQKLLSYFTRWKEYFGANKLSHQLQQARMQYKTNLLKKYYHYLRVASKLIIHQEVQLHLKRTFRYKGIFMDKLRLNWAQNITILGKTVELFENLQGNRIVTALSFIFKYAKISQQTNLLKVKNFQKNRLKSNLHSFISISTKMKNKRMKKRQQQQQLQKTVKKQIIQDMKIKKQKIRKVRQQLTSCIRKVYINNIKNQLYLKLNAQTFSKNLICKRADTFLRKIKQSKKKNDQMKYKRMELKCYLTQRLTTRKIFDLRKFFVYFTAPKKLEKRINNFVQLRYRRKIGQYFVQWRIQSYLAHIAILTSKLNSLGPEIQQIALRHKATHEQKIALIKQLDQRTDLIKRFEKQLQEAHFTIKNKDIKYEKLKKLYAEVMQQNIYQDGKISNFSHILPPEKDFTSGPGLFDSESIDKYPTFRRF